MVRHKGRRDVPPLITIRSFSASASVVGLLYGPLHLHTVDLEGLEIRVPPGGFRDQGLAVPKPGEKKRAKTSHRSPIIVDTIRSKAARLEIATDRSDQAAARLRDPRSGR